MVLIALCIADATGLDGISVLTYAIPDLGRRALVGLAVEIEDSGVLRSIANTEIPGQLFAYIRGLHTLLENDGKNSLKSSTSTPDLKGGKTFASIIKPVLVFLRYLTKDLEDNIMEHLYLVMAIEANTRAKQCPGNVVSRQLMSLPKVATRVKIIRSSKEMMADSLEHEFDQNLSEATISPPR